MQKYLLSTCTIVISVASLFFVSCSKETAKTDEEPTVSELLTGGSAAVNGKTWVLSSGYTVGIDGASAIDNSMMVLLPSVENMLATIGLAEEYDNEYTFYADGRYSVDVKNGVALTSALYGNANGTIVNYGNEQNSLRIYGGSYTAPANATWTLHHNEDLVVDACSNPLGTDVPAVHGNVTIKGRDWVTLSDGAFFGIVDYPVTRKFIIKQITADKMYVALFVCGYSADPRRVCVIRRRDGAFGFGELGWIGVDGRKSSERSVARRSSCKAYYCTCIS